MPQFAVVVHAPAPADPMALSSEDLAALEQYGQQVSDLGGKVVTGFALAPSTTARSIRGDEVIDGPLGDGALVVSGYFVLDAPDPDVALEIARLNPATRDGAVEVRPLFEPPTG